MTDEHKTKAQLIEELRTLRQRVAELESVPANAAQLVEARSLEVRLQETNARLERQLRFTEALLSAVPIPLFFKDAQGRYLGCNEAFSDQTGVSAEEIKGKTVHELWPGEHAAVYHQKDTALIQHPEHQVYDFKVRDKTGQDRDVIFTKDVFYDEAGQVAGLVGAYVDITERKQAEEILRESEERARRQRAAIAEIVLDEAIVAGEIATALKRITWMLSETVGVERASVWTLSEDGLELQCLSLFEAETREHSEGTILKTAEFPRYFEAILAESRIYAQDAQADPRTSELTEGYLARLGITSMLDAAIVVEGRLAGVVCLEHVGDMRKWHPDEEALASTAAAIVAQVFANAERRRAEEALRESEERYRTLVGNVPIGVYRTTAGPEGRFLMANPAFLATFGIESETELAQISVADLYQEPEKRAQFSKQLLAQGRVTGVELLLRRRDGTPIWGSVTAQAVYDDDGEVAWFDCTMQDVTERKQAEIALTRQLEELSVLHAVASACAQATDEDLLVADLTGLMCQTLYPEDVGLFMVDAAEGVLRPHPSYHQSAGALVEFIRPGEGVIGQAARNGQPRRVADVLEEPGYIQASPATRSELAVPIKLGARVIAVINAESSHLGFFTANDERLLSTVAGQLATAIERIRLDQEMRRRLAELEALHRASREIMAAGVDPERVYASVHRVVAELMPCEAFLITLHGPAHNENEGVYLIDKGERWPSMRYPADEGLSGLVISRGEGILVDDYVQQDNVAGVHFGAPEPVRSILAAPLRAGERVVGMLSAQTYRPHAYTRQDQVLLETLANHVAAGLENARLFQQIQEQARRVQGIIDTVPEGVLLLDADQRVLLANPVAERDLSLLTGSGVGDVITHLGDRPLAEMLTSPPQGLWHEVEVGARVFEVIARPIDNGPAPEWWVLVISDATQARTARRQIEQQERLATVGQLAAGIAHDFNNILASIMLYAHLCLSSPDLSPELGERMQVILAEAGSAANLVQQILDFGRRAMIERASLDLLPLLKETVKLLKRTLPEHVEIELAYGDEGYTTHADPTRVQQAIVNLTLNACDAMPDGGDLRISLCRVSGDEGVRCVTCGPATEGEWIEMAVTDTGIGIPPEVLPHIFEPFFTTRAPLGHGLGLAQVYGIVKQHEGHLDVETEVGVGTTFRLYWPALPVAAGAVHKEPSTPLTIGHGEIILIVEDDAALREALVDALEALKYAVLEAEHGRRALEMLESHGDEIALVLSDWVMPVMGGLALAQEMQARFPEIKVLMLTGHPLSEATRIEAPAGVIGWVQKPLDLGQLAAAVAQVLEPDT